MPARRSAASRRASRSPSTSARWRSAGPGSWNRALVSGVAVGADQIVAIFACRRVSRRALHARSRIGRVKASISTPWLRTPARVLPVQAPVAATLSVSAPPRSSLQLLMFSTTKLRPLKVFSWKFLNSWRNSGDVHVDAVAVEFRAEFEGVVRLRLELQMRRDWLVGRTAPLPPERVERRRRVEVEAARLVAARIARVGQQPVGRLVAEHGGARELSLRVRLIAIQWTHCRQGTAGRCTHGSWLEARRAAAAARQRLAAATLLSVRSAFELLALVRVAQAERELELVGDREDVVGEERPVVAGLVLRHWSRRERRSDWPGNPTAVARLRKAAVGDERRVGRRTARAARRQRAPVGSAGERQDPAGNGRIEAGRVGGSAQDGCRCAAGRELRRPGNWRSGILAP